MEENNVNRLWKSLRSHRWWIYLVSVLGLLFIAFMTWKFVINDHYFFKREPMVQVILVGLAVVGTFRYILFVRQQAALSKNNGRNEQEKMEVHYRRSFYFWLTEAILTVGAMGLFLYLVYEGI